MCNTLAIENVEHLLIHCAYSTDKREAMLREINDLEKYYDTVILTLLDNNLLPTLRKIPENAKPEVMLYFYSE